ncbi:MAG: hypothetical protein K9K67_10145 [Bacteriovoracaceae bacterium]|nr:hypothetical protein [Bacteriovoracaceae bacterium]
MMFKLLVSALLLLKLSSPSLACEGRELIEGRPFSDVQDIEGFVMATECRGHEEQFRRHILQRFNESIANWQRVLDCNVNETQAGCLAEQESFEELSKSVQNHRVIQTQIYQSIAQNWLSSLNPGIRGSVENCFLSPEEREENPPSFQFDSHVRVLRVREGIEPTLCLSQKGMWEEQLIHAEREARNNPLSVGVTADDIEYLNEFENSFAGYLLSQDTRNNPNYTIEEQNQAILRDIRLGIESMQNYQEEISQYGENQMHRLYQFSSMYLDQFVASLPEDTRDATFPRCRRESNFSCLRVATPGYIAQPEDLARCASQAGDVLGEVIPFYGVFDAYQDIIRTRSSFIAGAITESERDSRNTQSAFSILFGVPLVPASGAAVSRIGTGILARQSTRLPRQVFAPTTLDDLPQNIHPNIRERIVSGFERLSRTNPQVIEEGNGAIFFHGSSSRSLTAFGTNNSAGGLRPTGQLRARGIEPLSGELGSGVSTGGINQNYLSAVDISGFEEAVRYTSIARSTGAERAIYGLTREQQERAVQNYMIENGITDTPTTRRDIIDLLGVRVVEPANLGRYSEVERGFIDQQFPILYGLRPQGELETRILGARAGLPSNTRGEAAINGGVSFDEIRSIFVPPERVDQVRRFLIDNGITNPINVVPYNFN